MTLFPLARWRRRRSGGAPRAARRRSTTATRAASAALREVLADHLGRTRGVIAEPEQILVVQGTAQGVEVLLRVLATRGARRVAVEDPSHTTPARAHPRARARRWSAQPVDEDGLTSDGGSTPTRCS